MYGELIFSNIFANKSNINVNNLKIITTIHPRKRVQSRFIK